MTVPLYESRAQERRRAVQEPGDINTVLAAAWPPYTREELSKLSRLLRLGAMTPGNDLPRYFASRIRRLLEVLQSRMARYGRTATWTAVAPNGQKILFPVNDAASVAFKKVVDEYDQLYEKALIAFVTARLGPRDVFVDVGANVGYISAFAATTGASVFAVEMQRELLPLIEQLATINGFDQLRPLHVAASARSGMSMMPRIGPIPGARLGGQSVRFTRNEPRSIVHDFVPMLALDDAFLDRHVLPRLVKIDVEGHEIGVLEGCRRIIETGRTTFVVEFHPHLVDLFGRTADDLLAPFDRGRWTLFQLDDDGLRPIHGMADVRPDPRDPNPKLVFEPRAA